MFWLENYLKARGNFKVFLQKFVIKKKPVNHLGNQKSLTRYGFSWLQRYDLFGIFSEMQISARKEKLMQIWNILFIISKCFYLFAKYINDSLQSWIWHWPHCKNITLISNECYPCLLIISDNNLSIHSSRFNTVSMLLVFILTIIDITTWVINTNEKYAWYYVYNYNYDIAIALSWNMSQLKQFKKFM